MWLITPIGFFSVVQKPGDAAANTLTVRARVRSDLEALRQGYLPALGEITESTTNDYRFRAVAPRADVAAVMASMVSALDYSNFKNQVAKVQGVERAHLYHDVWAVLHELQSVPKQVVAAKATPVQQGTTFHPRKDNHGRAVHIKQPSSPSPVDTWHRPDALAVVIPNGPMPPELHGIPVASWTDVPTTPDGWLELANEHQVVEPEFVVPAGYRKAAGVVVIEKNRRVWAVAPSNAYGGYEATFPKGTVEPGMQLQATALIEAFEESGLKVRLVRHLVDVKRSQSYTRYYVAERVGGNPADMGWETQAVMLVPPGELSTVLTHPNDKPILQALARL